MRKHTWPQSFIDKLVADYAAGKSLGQLAADRGLNTEAVRRALLRAKVTLRPKNEAIELDRHAVVAAYLNGTPVRELAQQNGCSTHVIYKALRERKVEMQYNRTEPRIGRAKGSRTPPLPPEELARLRRMVGLPT